MTGLRLMAVLPHPDDESLGFGGVLTRYAAEGVDTSLVTATHGQSGRFRGHERNTPGHPGEDALAGIREVELRAAARVLGIGDVSEASHQVLWGRQSFYRVFSLVNEARAREDDLLAGLRA
jgi:LmbE family N-acetylglucosaminyl deacetylase